jgi:hypothetical protein
MAGIAFIVAELPKFENISSTKATKKALGFPLIWSFPMLY